MIPAHIHVNDAAGRPAVRFAVLALLILAAAMWRLLGYALPADSPLRPPWNFAPITAIALFAGMMYSQRWAAFAVPVAAMAASDVILHATGWAPLTNAMEWVQQATTYAIFIGVVGFGMGLRRLRERSGRSDSGIGLPAGMGTTLAAALICSVLFFLASNFVFWLGACAAPESLPPAFRYPPTPGGLATCYVNALPFFRGTLLGDLVFTGVLFGGYALCSRWLPYLRHNTAVVDPA